MDYPILEKYRAFRLIGTIVTQWPVTVLTPGLFFTFCDFLQIVEKIRLKTLPRKYSRTLDGKSKLAYHSQIENF